MVDRRTSGQCDGSRVTRNTIQGEAEEIGQTSRTFDSSDSGPRPMGHEDCQAGVM